MAHDDPVTVLERWCDHGAHYRILHLSDAEAIVELRTCFGEPVERLESSDPRLLEYLRRVSGPPGSGESG
jgi:hypothetical protein